MSQNRLNADHGEVAIDVFAGVSIGDPGLYQRIGKRAFDIVASLGLIVLFSPLMAGITVILLLGGGAPTFAHARVGLNRREFACLKFRTMRKNSSRALRFMLRTDETAAEEWTEAQKLTFDPRVTRLGAFLRKSSLDELPQLFNVLKGEMSMVGPRPVTEKELSRYGSHLPFYLSVRPGLTGYWQVHGRGVTHFDDRVAMDCAYVRNVNFLTDVKLCAQTLGVVLKRTGT